MRTELGRLLHRARMSFDSTGRIPTDIAAHLMRLGVVVPELEDKWSRDRGEGRVL